MEIHVITKKEQESIQAILDSGALSVRNGSVTLHFDAEGTIRQVEIKQVTFRLDRLDESSILK
jgi:hypothetical protein